MAIVVNPAWGFRARDGGFDRLFGQSSGPKEPENHAGLTEARQIVGPSVLATERSWEIRDHYTYMERDEDRRLNSLGQVKSESVDVTE